MIGPWKLTINNFEYAFRAVTCIDAVINLPEIIPVDNAKSRTVTNALKDGYLSRYPVPARCVHDNGNEFLGTEFNRMLLRNKADIYKMSYIYVLALSRYGPYKIVAIFSTEKQ